MFLLVRSHFPAALRFPLVRLLSRRKAVLPLRTLRLSTAQKRKVGASRLSRMNLELRRVCATYRMEPLWTSGSYIAESILRVNEQRPNKRLERARIVPSVQWTL